MPKRKAANENEIIPAKHLRINDETGLFEELIKSGLFPKVIVQLIMNEYAAPVFPENHMELPAFYNDLWSEWESVLFSGRYLSTSVKWQCYDEYKNAPDPVLTLVRSGQITELNHKNGGITVACNRLLLSELSANNQLNSACIHAHFTHLKEIEKLQGQSVKLEPISPQSSDWNVYLVHVHGQRFCDPLSCNTEVELEPQDKLDPNETTYEPLVHITNESTITTNPVHTLGYRATKSYYTIIEICRRISQSHEFYRLVQPYLPVLCELALRYRTCQLLKSWPPDPDRDYFNTSCVYDENVCRKIQDVIGKELAVPLFCQLIR